MSTLALTDDYTLETVIESLIEHVSIPMQGDCTEETLFTVLVRAASTHESINHTCETLEDAPDGGTICHHLHKCQDMYQMEKDMNAALQARLPQGLRKRAQRVAIDLNLHPYYGTPTPHEQPYMYRSTAQSGTCTFYAYTTCYVICKNKRVTIAVTPVRRDDTMVGLITRLLDRSSRSGIQIKRLYLDRGFFSVPVIRWLQALQIPFEMPVIIRGKQGGTRQLLQTHKSYKTHYTMTSQAYGTVTFDVWVVGVYSQGRYGRHGREWFAYAVFHLPLGLRRLHHDYRLRFGIESSYRLKNTCRIHTTISNPVVRFLFFAIAFVLIDIWITLQWAWVSRPRQGGRLVFQRRFPLKRMLEFLRQAIDRKYHPKCTIFV